MKPRGVALFLLLSVGCAWSTSSGEGVVQVGDTDYHRVHHARHTQYRYSLSVVLEGLQETEFLFAYQDPQNFYRLTLAATSARLAAVEKGQERVLAAQSGRVLHGPATQEILIRRGKHRLSAVVNGVIVCHALDAAFHEGALLVRSQPGLDLTSLKLQPTGEIFLDDNFMQTEEDAADLGEWEPVTGKWALLSVLEQVRKSGHVRLRKGREPEAERSANPFSLSATTPEESVISTGHSFWYAYTAEVSGKTEGGQFGLVFGYQSPESYFVLRWSLDVPMLHPGKVELVRKSGRRERVLGESYVEGRTGNWYRLQVSAVDGRIRAGIDNTVLFDVDDPSCIGGRIGLSSRGGAAAFDDVQVRSQETVRLDTPETLSKVGSAVGPPWDVSGKRGDVELTPREPGPSIYALGDAHWREYLVQCRAKFAAGTSELGLICGPTEPGVYLLCRLADRKGQSGGVELVRISDQLYETVARFPAQVSRDQWLELALDLREPKVLKFYVDGQLEIRHHLQTPVVGRPALYSTGRGSFRDVRAFGELERDWQRSVGREIFVTDPYMQGWASPRWAWLPVEGPAAGGLVRYLYKGDFYGTLKVQWPVNGDATFFFGTDRDDPDDAYSLALDLDPDQRQLRAELKRRGAPVAEAGVPVAVRTVPASDNPPRPAISHWGELRIQREGRYVWASLDGRELLQFRDEDPRRGLNLGLVAAKDFDTSPIRVERDHVKDYLFERAPADWEGVGTWEVTNRFACDPRWSHLNGRSFGLAALWNKYSFTGDYTVEFYAGMRMRQGEMREGVAWSYPRAGDINLSFCGDGRDVFSGYTMLLAAWDPWWSERYSKLCRQGDVVTQTDQELIPHLRASRPRARVIDLAWDPGGRPIHGAWYYVKMRRRSGRVEVFFDNTRVLSYEDRKPLPGGRIALWTQDNSIVVARAKVAYEKTPQAGARVMTAAEARAHVPPAPRPPAFRIGSETHPGVVSDFEGHLCGWEPFRGDESALPSLDSSTKSEGRYSLKLTNMHAGGDFGVKIPIPRMDLSRVTELSFDYRVPKSSKVNLYFKTEEEPYVLYFVRLNGESRSHAAMVPVGDFAAAADGRWRHARINLGDALKSAEPWRRQFVVSSMMFGNLHEGYLNAGLGANPAGAVYHLDHFRLGTVGGNEAEFSFEGAEGAELSEFKWLVDQSPKSSPLRSGARSTEAERITDPAPGADATPTTTGPPARFAAIADAGHFETGVWYLHVCARTSGGRWAEPQHFQFEVTPPLSVQQVRPEPGAKWGGSPIRVQFARNTDARLVTATMRLTVAGKLVPLKAPVVTYDAPGRELSIDLQKASFTFEDKSTAALVLSYVDNRSSIPAPRPKDPVRSEWAKAHPQAWQLSPSEKHEWHYLVDYGQDRFPPSAAEIAGRLLDEDFEESVGKLVSYAGNHGAVLSLDPETPDGSRHSLKMENKVAGGYSGATLVPGTFETGRFPLFCFDYRTDGHLRLDFHTSAGGVARGIGFTDHDAQLSLIGSVPDVKSDGRWHHAEFSIKEMMDSAMSSFRANHYQGANFILGDFGYRANPPGVSVNLDNLKLVPVVSSVPGLKLEWSARDTSGLAGYSYKWSGDPKAEPGRKVLCSEPSAVFSNLPDGEQYLHVRAQDTAGNWGPSASYRYVIDNLAPRITGLTPRDNAYSASATVDIQFEETGAGIDPSSFALRQDGKGISLSSSYVTCDVHGGVLKWHWAKARAPMNEPIKHGTVMKYELAPLKDFAGNQTEPVSWSWRIDYSKDREGPARPEVTCPTLALVSHDSFTDKLGAWRPLGDKGGELSLHFDEERRDQCLKIATVDTWDNSAAHMPTKFDAAQFPLVSFDYKFPRGANLMLRLYINNRFACVKLTKEPEGYDNLGTVPGIVADGRWRHAEVDVLTIARNAFPDDTAYSVGQIAIGNWSREFNPKGTAYYIDDFLISGSGSPVPVYEWHTYDPTGIAGFSFVMDRQPLTQPKRKVLGTSLIQHLPLIDEPGFWYLHLQARDGAGNWSPTVHLPYRCEDLPPPTASDGLEARPGWEILDQPKGTVVNVAQTKTASGKNSLLSIFFKGPPKQPVEFFLSCPALASLAGKTEIVANTYCWGAGKAAIGLAARFGGKVKPMKPIQALTPKTWSQDLKFPLADVRAWRKLKKQPGEEQPTPGRPEVGFWIRAAGPTGQVLIDDIRAN